VIITASFKTPDVLDWALDEVDFAQWRAIKKKLGRWVEYEECVTIEFDTDKMTATVLKV